MFERPAVKLAAYGVTLALALGGGALAGAALGPAPSTDAPDHGDEHVTTSTTTPATSLLTLPDPAQRDEVSEEPTTTTVAPHHAGTTEAAQG